MSEQRLRILCLHGLGMNNRIMKRSMKQYERLLGAKVEFSYLEANMSADGWVRDNLAPKKFIHEDDLKTWVDVNFETGELRGMEKALI